MLTRAAVASDVTHIASFECSRRRYLDDPINKRLDRGSGIPAERIDDGNWHRRASRVSENLPQAPGLKVWRCGES